MKNTKTLTANKPQQPNSLVAKSRPSHRLLGKLVTIQTKSPSRIVGEIRVFDGGNIVIVGTEYRWLPTGEMSAPVTTGQFTLDRSNVTYICEVE